MPQPLSAALAAASGHLPGDGALALLAGLLAVVALAMARPRPRRRPGVRLLLGGVLVFAVVRVAAGFLIDAEAAAGMRPAGVAEGSPVAPAYAEPMARAKAVAPRARGA